MATHRSTHRINNILSCACAFSCLTRRVFVPCARVIPPEVGLTRNEANIDKYDTILFDHVCIVPLYCRICPILDIRIEIRLSLNWCSHTMNRYQNFFAYW